MGSAKRGQELHDGGCGGGRRIKATFLACICATFLCGFSGAYKGDFSEGIKDFFFRELLVINRGARAMDDYQDVLVAEVKRLREVVATLREQVVSLVRENKSLYSLLSTKRAEEKEKVGEEGTIKTMLREKVDSMLLNREIELLLKEKPENEA